MGVEERIVAAADADIRLDRWFRRHVPQLTQGALQRMLRTGQVRLDGRRADTSDRVAAGSRIRIPPLPEAPPPKPRPEVPAALARELRGRILHRDEHVLALDKPAGLAVQGGPGITRSVDHTLDALRLDGAERPRLVHRLDRDTSGVLLLGLSAAAAAALAAAFRHRDARKTYWAVVVGRPPQDSGRVDLALARAGARNDPDPQGQHAITDYVVRDTAGRRAAWLELSPLTGRTHQLRAHCAALGCPILGDGRYAGADAQIAGLDHRLHLHARAIELPHPAGGTLRVAAPLPPHMVGTFTTLGFTVPRR
jgi:23S rRNA pseudouridine955/2504/2580 synthase